MKTQGVIKDMHKRCSKTEERILQAKEELEKAQTALVTDRFNERLLEKENECRVSLDKWIEVKEKNSSAKGEDIMAETV